jgi:hypothetical protein
MNDHSIKSFNAFYFFLQKKHPFISLFLWLWIYYLGLGTSLEA